MFDITSSKLLILAILALLVVGPKDLPLLLRTVGKYLGIIRRQAAEFRAQLDEALRESELDQLKKDFESAGDEMRATLVEGTNALAGPVEQARLGDDATRKGASTGEDSGSADADAPKRAEDAAARPEKTGT